MDSTEPAGTIDPSVEAAFSAGHTSVTGGTFVTAPSGG